MRLTITSIDGPEQLAVKAPFVTDLVRQLPGPDRPDYWIAALQSPITVVLNNFDLTVTHLVLAARWEGSLLATGATHVPLGIAYVTDLSLLNDPEVDFEKCHYVAIGVGSVTTGAGSWITLPFSARSPEDEISVRRAASESAGRSPVWAALTRTIFASLAASGAWGQQGLGLGRRVGGEGE